MRWLLPLAALPFILAGCLGSPASVFDSHRGEDCSVNQAGLVAASADVVFPSEVPDDVKQQFGPVPRITVHAREGQTLHASASWAPVSGDVGVVFDGPSGHQVVTERTWSSFGEVSEGDYTLELEGTPMGFQVTYTLQLVATGCTPIVD